MMSLDELLERMHKDYLELNPQAQRIYQLLAERGEHPINDHIAIRTFSGPQIGAERIAAPFEELGYSRVQAYDFPAKGLRGWHFEHDDGQRPKIFISELLVDELAEPQQQQVRDLLDSLPEKFAEDPSFLIAGRPWPVSTAIYESLRGVSEYAAWLAAFGLRANHFTVDVNSLQGFDDIFELNHFLAEEGFPLNEAGGLVKGTEADGLQQSSTRAGAVTVQFSDGELKIPACYVEFAQRFKRADGKVFQGFVAGSADRIFESTDRKKPETTRIKMENRRLSG